MESTLLNGTFLIFFFIGGMRLLFVQLRLLSKLILIRIPISRIRLSIDPFIFQEPYIPLRFRVENHINNPVEIFYELQTQLILGVFMISLLILFHNELRFGIDGQLLDFPFVLFKQFRYRINAPIILWPIIGICLIRYTYFFLVRFIKNLESKAFVSLVGHFLKFIFKKSLERLNYAVFNFQRIPNSEFGNFFLYKFSRGIRLKSEKLMLFGSKCDTQHNSRNPSLEFFRKIDGQLSNFNAIHCNGYFFYKFFLYESQKFNAKYYENS